jgi:hypothetical protein
VAARAAEQCRALGLVAEVLTRDPQHPGAVDPRAGGPEAAARALRYALLDDAADRHSLAAVLLGHTRDDQAETVLLGLARGSGARALSGMPAVRGATTGRCSTSTAPSCAPPAPRRGCTRTTTPTTPDASYAARACAPTSCRCWSRRTGPGVAAALARTARPAPPGPPTR